MREPSVARSLRVDPCFTGGRSCLPADRVDTYADENPVVIGPRGYIAAGGRA